MSEGNSSHGSDTRSTSEAHSEEVRRGERFEFGANWAAFLSTLNDDRILEAEESLKEMLNVTTLEGKTMLDIGSGSGLFSLAARRLGAKVHSFDYDPKSVGCTKELKSRYYATDDDWHVESGSVLDKDYIESLGKFDIVYSWGVLHHTGDMMTALNHAMLPVKQGGMLFIAIYNDQGVESKVWTKIKKTYCSGPIGKAAMGAVFVPFFAVQGVAASMVKYGNPISQFTDYKSKRGMSIYHDWIDWLGGYPFEVATPELILNLYKEHGYVLENLISTNRLGCNQFLFRHHG